MSDFTCPHLGRADDPETAFAFPSPGHRCFRLEEASPIAESHQAGFCLTDNYTECPVFRFASSLLPDEEKAGSTAAPLPAPVSRSAIPATPVPPATAELEPSPSSTSANFNVIKFMTFLRPLFERLSIPFPGQNPAILTIFFIALAILVVSVLFFLIVASSYFSSPAVETVPTSQFAAALPNESQPNVFVMTLTPTLRSAFIKKMGQASGQQGALISPYSGSVATQSPDTVVVTPTSQATGVSYHACGAPADWVPYTVQTGDSLTGLTVVYDTPLHELSTYNCLSGTENLYVGQQLYVPPQ